MDFLSIFSDPFSLRSILCRRQGSPQPAGIRKDGEWSEQKAGQQQRQEQDAGGGHKYRCLLVLTHLLWAQAVCPPLWPSTPQCP